MKNVFELTHEEMNAILCTIHDRVGEKTAFTYYIINCVSMQ